MDEQEKELNKPNESALTNILLNVLLPVMVLSFMSKDPAISGGEPKPWHVGPYIALLIAIAIPLCYAIYHFAKTRKLNLFSAIGLVSVLLTGGVTLYLWNPDGTVKPDAALWFGMKEAIQPLILGGVVLASHWSKSPLFHEFIYNQGLFDIARIETGVEKRNVSESYQKLIFRNTLLFCASFVISAVLNLLLADYFLGSLDFSAQNARELYNQGVAKISGWGFVVIGVPLMVIAGVIIFKHASDLRKLTGLPKEDILLLGS